MTPLLLALLIGGHPAVPDSFRLHAEIPWGSIAAEPPGPRITSPVPEEAGGWRFEFTAGSAASAGYAQVPVPGDRLLAVGAQALELEYRMRGVGPLDVVLVSSRGTYRSPLAPTEGAWSVARVPLDGFRRGDGARFSPLESRARFLRIEPRPAGLVADVTLDLRWMEVVRGRPPDPVEALPRSAAAGGGARSPAPDSGVRVRDGSLHAGDEPLFPFGLFLLGANRSLIERIGLAGANTLVEYGPASWSVEVVEDYLDYAQAAGVRVAAALTQEMHGRLEEADGRLAPLGDHPGLLGWYLFDEPDGATGRGHDPTVCTPEVLRARRDRLGDRPVLVTCLNSFGLRRYASAGDMLCVDFYWPAYGPQRSAAIVHSAAESAVEIAAEQAALPIVALQLAAPQWTGERVTTPRAMRAQYLAALAAGVRGVLFFEGVAALRLAQEKGLHDWLWPEFLELASEAATIGPMAARWERWEGGLDVQPALGEVRAACFQADGTRWLVMVNLGKTAAEVRLSGAALEGVRELRDPRNGWRGRVRNGAWEGRIDAFDGRVVRIVPENGSGPPQPVVEAVLPSTDGVRYDRAMVGATLYPAPDGRITLSVDGRKPKTPVQVHRGAAAVVRCVVRELAPGSHRVTLAWEDGGRRGEKEWSFRVDPIAWPFEDSFDRPALGDAWAPVRDVRWNQFDREARPARGVVAIEGGALHVRSTRGATGALLRRFEAPESFRMSFRVRLPEAGAVLVQRNELFRRIPVPAGTHTVTFLEVGGQQRARVEGEPTDLRWTTRIDHRGGVVALGVPAGGEAWFDDVRVEPWGR